MERNKQMAKTINRQVLKPQVGQSSVLFVQRLKYCLADLILWGKFFEVHAPWGVASLCKPQS